MNVMAVRSPVSGSVRVPCTVHRLSALDHSAVRDRVPVADVAVEVVLLDDLAHVLEDLVGRGDRGARPRLEPVAERVEVAVGADARVLVRQPRAAEALERLEDDERLLRALSCR